MNNIIDTTYQGHLAIIGAGIAGLSCAKTCIKQGIDFILFEKEGTIGGVWEAFANPESMVQSDSASYRDLDDTRPLDVSGKGYNILENSLFQKRDSVLSSLDNMVSSYHIAEKIFFNREFIGFENVIKNGRSLVIVKVRDLINQKIIHYLFKGLHIRTGMLTNPQCIKFHGEDNFKGSIVMGISNDIKLEDLKDKNVVILGFGPFAIENVRRALMANAKNITVLSRKFNKALFPKVLSYLVTRIDYGLDQVEDLKKFWRNVCNTVQTFAKFTKTEHIAFSKYCYSTINDEPSLCVYPGGTSVSNYVFLLSYYYSLVSCYEDEVIQFSNQCVITKHGRTIDADVVIKCFGFSRMETSYRLTDSLFIDNQSNLTHFTPVCYLEKPTIFSSLVNNDVPFLTIFDLSYIFENFIMLLNKSPELYSNYIMRDNKINLDISTPDYMSYIRTFQVLYKLSTHDQNIHKIFNSWLEKKTKQYANNLPKDLFLVRNKHFWNSLSEELFKRSNKKVPYLGFELIEQELDRLGIDLNNFGS